MKQPGFLPTLRGALITLLAATAACRAQPALVDDHTLRRDGQLLRNIDDEGVFVYAASEAPGDVPPPKPNRSYRMVLEHRGWTEPVLCRLVDAVDCTDPATHAFTDDGRSRVRELPGGRFRVTGPVKGFELAWFAYEVQTAGTAGTPHLIVVESPNDRERYTTVSLTVPKGEPWSAPFRGVEATPIEGYPLYLAPDWYTPDVGLDVYTGRDLPTDGRPFRWHYLFYPKTDRMKVTVSSSGWEKPDRQDTGETPVPHGGAVSRIWVFEVQTPLRERLPRIEPPASGPQRRVGVYTTHPWYWLSHYGLPPFTREQRRASLEKMCDLLAFCGMNLIQFNAINGSDRATRAWYPGSWYAPCGTDPMADSTSGPSTRASQAIPHNPQSEMPVDLLTELPPVAAERGIDVIPVLTSITAPCRGGDPCDGDTPNAFGFSRLSFQAPADARTDPRAFDQRAPDPLRPETQRWVIRHLVEMAEGSRGQPNVPGVGFRVNGKIGTCYIAGEHKVHRDKPGRIIPAAEMGYSRWNLEEFRRETGLDVPLDDSGEAYCWLRGVPERWNAWLDFRCRRTRQFWLEARDAVRAVRPGGALYVLTDLPAETPATNVDWPGSDGSDGPDTEAASLELLRAHGYDPRLFREDEGIIVQRVMMLDMERFFGKWGPPWGSHPGRYRAFHEQDSLARWYRTPAGSAVELYHTYWEEPYHPDGEFGADPDGKGLRTATATAKDRAFYRPAAFTLRAANNDTLVFTGWQRPTLGHEHDLRRFCQAVRALPAAEPRPLTTEPAHRRILAAWYGNRIGVIHDRPEPVAVRVHLDKPLDPGVQLRDAATDKIVIPPDGGERATFTLDVEAYDLRTLIPERPIR